MDISPLNVKGRLRKVVAVGPSPSDDSVLIATGAVYDFDPAGGRVRVGVRGGDVWLPAVAGRYSSTSLARVLLDPTSARPVMVLGPVNPRKPAELGFVTATATGTVTVTVNGVSYTIPAPVGTYTVGSTAWVLLDEWATPILALSPSTDAAAIGGVSPPTVTSKTVTATATVGPQWSGTWQGSQSRWNNWNAGRYGGGSNIYQGSYSGSGLLQGFAAYGNQVANLGAISILSITMQARKNDTNGLSAALTVQGSSSGTQPGGAPSSSGDTASTGSIGPGGWGGLTFTSNMCEAFRTGSAKGLCAVGSQYGGFGGTATPGSFVLQITYTKNA